MPQPRRAQRWLALGATSLALALMLLFAGMPLIAPYGDGIVVAQGDDDDNSNDNSAPTSPSMPAAPMPMPSPSPSTGSGTGTGTGTSTPPGSGTQQTSAPAPSTQLTTSGDPTRGGVEMPGQPACYQPAKNITERKMYNESRPACAGEQQ